MGEVGARIGIIAGNGRFPIIFADNVKQLGYWVSAIAHVGETLPELESHVDRIHWLKVGQFTKALRAFQQDGVRQAVMLGGVKKTHVFTTLRPDLRALSILSRLKHWKDDAILRAIAGELEKEGISICDSTFGLQGVLADVGVLSRRSPSKKEEEDLRYGWEILERIGSLDIGQCVVIKDRVVVAVEAVEGTDQTILRAGTLAGKGSVVVKRTKPHQDLRFDLPAVGPRTIEHMATAKATVLAVEAGRTVLLDQAELLDLACRHSIAVVGLSSQASCHSSQPSESDGP